MAISNPLNIIFWLGIYGAILAKTSVLYSHFQIFIYSSAIFLGIFLWDLFMASLSSTFRRFMTSKLLSLFSIAAGVTLIGFGVYFGYEAYRLIF